MNPIVLFYESLSLCFARKGTNFFPHTQIILHFLANSSYRLSLKILRITSDGIGHRLCRALSSITPDSIRHGSPESPPPTWDAAFPSRSQTAPSQASARLGRGRLARERVSGRGILVSSPPFPPTWDAVFPSRSQTAPSQASAYLGRGLPVSVTDRALTGFRPPGTRAARPRARLRTRHSRVFPSFSARLGRGLPVSVTDRALTGFRPPGTRAARLRARLRTRCSRVFPSFSAPRLYAFPCSIPNFPL